MQRQVLVVNVLDGDLLWCFRYRIGDENGEIMGWNGAIMRYICRQGITNRNHVL